jgi:hypothetical protein
MHCRMCLSACSSECFGPTGLKVRNAVQNTRKCTSDDTMLQHRRHYCSAVMLFKTLGTAHPMTQCYNTEDILVQQHHQENLQYHATTMIQKSRIGPYSQSTVHISHLHSSITLKFITLHTHQQIVIKVAFSWRFSDSLYKHFFFTSC